MLYKPNLHNRLKWMFRLYDQNSDGLIDQKELKTAIRVKIFCLRLIEQKTNG